jgi:hypothetical protein
MRDERDAIVEIKQGMAARFVGERGLRGGRTGSLIFLSAIMCGGH